MFHAVSDSDFPDSGVCPSDTERHRSIRVGMAGLRHKSRHKKLTWHSQIQFLSCPTGRSGAAGASLGFPGVD